MLTVSLWQSVALSLNIEPEDRFAPGWSGGFGVRRHTLPPEYLKRLEIACNHLENGHLQVVRRKPNTAYSEVALNTLAAWADRQDWKLPDQWPRTRRAVAASDRSPKTVTARLEPWYRDEYVPAQRRTGVMPSRDDDLTAARVAGFNVSRDQIRELRSKHAPKDWTISGRRKSGASNSGDD